jgi:Flp pilus assembly protein TadG
MKGRNGQNLAGDRSGVTAVEFALVALPFFTLAFGIIEIGLVHFANRMLDNAVVSAARLIRTGQAQGKLDQAQFEQSVCDFMPSFMCDTSKIYVDVQSVPDFASAGSTSVLYDEDGNLKDETSYDTGGASEIVVVNVVYKWPMMTSIFNFDAADHGGERHLTSTMVFRNEPWE